MLQTPEFHGWRLIGMRYLWISPYFFIPTDSGSKLRVFNLLSHCSKSRDISVICFYEKDLQMPPPQEELSKAKVYAKDVKVFERSLSSHKRLFKFFRAVFKRDPLYVDNFNVPMAHAEIQRMIASGEPMVVQADEIYTAQYLLGLPSVYTILILHNVDSMVFWRSILNHPNYIRKLFYLFQFVKMRLYERRVIPRIDKCFCVSDADKRKFESIFRGRVKFDVLPNGADTKAIALSPACSMRTLMFVGVLRYPQNLLAIEWFLTKIFPLIIQEMPDVSLNVVGAGVSEQLRDWEKKSPVHFHGYVEDVSDWYAVSKIVVAPLQIGSGTKLKILEAMAYGRPVVTTTVGCEGIEARNGEEILIADDPAEFAGRVLELFRSADLYDKIVSNARKLVEVKYDWKAIAEKLQNTYNAVENKQNEQ
jgi:polysaccharide biosynthesis protein PslH